MQKKYHITVTIAIPEQEIRRELEHYVAVRENCKKFIISIHLLEVRFIFVSANTSRLFPNEINEKASDGLRTTYSVRFST